MRKQPPLLIRGGLSGRVFVVTRYVKDAEGRTVATEKFDVTEQFNALASCGCVHDPDCGWESAHPQVPGDSGSSGVKESHDS